MSIHYLTPHASAGRRHGFTLVEMLVVISVIALLVSILLPALSQAQSSAKKSSCLSNLRQWGIASAEFAGDSSGKVPRGIDYYTKIGRAHV